MPFTIRPDFHPRSYGTGDTITGEVVLENAPPELIGRIFIELWGRTKTKIMRRNGNSRVTYRGRHHLFSKTVVVHTESTPLERGGTYKWPFVMAFPTGLPSIKDSDQQVNNRLPPSFEDNAMEWGAHYESFIEYKLNASICRHQSNEVMHFTDLGIKYAPTFPADKPIPDPRNQTFMQRFMAKSLLLLPENDGRELTFKEKTKSVFHSSKLPAAAFKFTATCPSVVLAGTKFILMAGLEHLPGETTAPQTPTVELQSIYASLKCYTSVVAEGAFHNPQDTAESTLWKKTWTGLRAFNKGEAWTKILSTALPGMLAPTFKTFNISRQYCLKIHATIKCADKTFDFVAGSGRTTLLVLPRQAERRQEVDVGAASSAAGDIPPPAEEQLPSYQEALTAPEPVPPPPPPQPIQT